MDIFATVFAAGVPQNGLTDDPEVRITDDTGTIVQAFVAMTDLGQDGKHVFAYAIPDVDRTYTFLVDADPNVTSQVPASDRYYFGSFRGDQDFNQVGVLAYPNGIWIDTIGGGAAGQVLGVNGTETNPSSNVTDALAIATALGIRRFKLRGGITLNAAFPFAIWEAVAGGGTIDPAGFDVGSGIFVNVGLTGTIGTGSGGLFGFQTSLLASTGFVGVLVRPGLTGTITLGAGITTIAQGASLVPGLSTPIIDLNGVASLNLRAYSGGLDLRGSSAGGQNSSIEIVAGQIILDASNTAGTIAVRGWPNVIDNSAGATINTAGLGSVIVDNELTAQHGSGNWNEAAILAAIGLLNDLSIADVQTALTNQGYTVARGILLDNLDAAITTRSTLTQADILSDATAFPGANVDSSISSRAVPGDLMGLTAATLTAIQGLILSDATPFQGADIAAILTSALNLREFIEGGRDIDFVGSDVLGWQRIERDTSGTLIRRYNLFDEAGSRINETVASFIGRQGMISSEVAI